MENENDVTLQETDVSGETPVETATEAENTLDREEETPDSAEEPKKELTEEPADAPAEEPVAIKTSFPVHKVLLCALAVVMIAAAGFLIWHGWSFTATISQANSDAETAYNYAMNYNSMSESAEGGDAYMPYTYMYFYYSNYADMTATYLIYRQIVSFAGALVLLAGGITLLLTTLLRGRRARKKAEKEAAALTEAVAAVPSADGTGFPCPVCGSVQPSGALFCSVCGASFADTVFAQEESSAEEAAPDEEPVDKTLSDDTPENNIL